MSARLGCMFSGGLSEIRGQVAELRSLLPANYSDKDIQRTLIYMSSLSYTTRDSSSYRVVEIGAMLRPDNKFTYEDNMTIYTFAATKYLERLLPGIETMDCQTRERVIKDAFAAMGNNPNGCTTNEIPDGYGEFALCVTNLVPVR